MAKRMENFIHNRKAERDLTNKDIANAMTAAGEPTSPEQVGHIFTGNSGVTLDKLEAFLKPLGIKLADEDSVCLPKDEHESMAKWAMKYLAMVAGGKGR
jgi:hypothetical protein